MRILKATAGIAALCCAMPAIAQDATPQEAPQADEGLQDIVVTAQKRSQSLNDVGLSIQAFSGDALRESGVATASDMSQVVSGLNFSRSNANTPIFTLRGIEIGRASCRERVCQYV